MEYNFIPMTLDYAYQIKSWEYKGFVKDIYMKPYFESYDERTGKMNGPGGCEGFAVLHENKLIGLFEYYFKDNVIEIGLALNPNMVGKGLGKRFVIEGVNFGIKKFNYRGKYIQLSVNIENEPAIRVYEKAGFKEYKKTNDEIEMRKYIDNL